MIGALSIALFGLVAAALCGLASYKQWGTWVAPFLLAMSLGGIMIFVFYLGLAESYYSGHDTYFFVPFSRIIFFFILFVTSGFGIASLRKDIRENGQ